MAWGDDPVLGAGSSGYMSGDQFKAAMDRVYGAGKWHETGGWRSQARENALREQGAQTVAPGAVSAHSLGTVDAPGAHDVVVDGLTPAQAAAALKSSGLPITRALPEGTAGTQGPHLHIALAPGAAPPAASVWGADDPVVQTWGQKDPIVGLAAGAQASQNTLGRLAGSTVGGVEEGVAATIKGAAGAADAWLHAQERQEAQTGVMTSDGGAVIILTPQERAEAAAAGTARAPVLQTSVAPVIGAINRTAQATEPANRSGLESFAHGVGSFGVPMVAAVADPLLGAAAFGAQGYGQTYDEAVAAGASPQVAERAGAESGGAQAAIGMIPFSKALEPVVQKVAQPVLGALARTGAEVAAGGTMNAGIQGSENVVAQQNYDPNRPLLQNVPEAFAQGAVAGGLIHGATEAYGAARGTLRPREQPQMPAGAATAGADISQMPATDAIRAYAGLAPAEPAVIHQPASASTDGSADDNGAAGGMLGTAVNPEGGAPPVGPDGVPLSAGGQTISMPGGTRTGGRRGPSAGVETLIPGEAPAPPSPGSSVLVDDGNGGMLHGVLSSTDEAGATVQTATGPVRASAQQIRQLPPDFEAARIAEGAPISEMPQAISDVSELQSAAPKNYNLFQAMRDLGGIRTRDADGNLDGDLQQAFGDKRLQPGVVNNKTGLTADATREALQQRDWFGAFDQSQGADDLAGERRGDTIQDLHDLINQHVRSGPVVHPDSETAPMIARRAELEQQMDQAGVGVKDTIDVAAAKLAAYRAAEQKQEGAAMEMLRARADSAGVPHDGNSTYDGLLGDVVEREAIADHYNGAAADHDESLIDAELTHEEHDWLSSPERGPVGEQVASGEAPISGEGGAFEPFTPPGYRELGEGAGGSREGPAAVPGAAELAPVNPFLPAATERVNLGHETVDQGVLPGGEQSARQAAAARGETLKPKVAQQDAGGLFAPPEPEQNDLKFQRPAEKNDLERFADDIKDRFGLHSLSMHVAGNGSIRLSMIRVPREELGRGSGTKAMEEITKFADDANRRITLTPEGPEGAGTTSTKRLIDFYKRFDFVENKGRRKDFSMSDRMYRDPQPSFERRSEQARAAPGDFEHVTRGLEGERAPPDDPQRAYDTMRAVQDVLDRLAPSARNEPYSRLRDTKGGTVEGAAFRDKMGPVIAWALDGADAVRTARHEAVHALKTSGLFTGSEWDALASTARSSGWLDRYGIKDRYGDLTPAQQVEEAIAERFADWRKTPVQDFPSFVKALFNRMAMAVDRIADAVRQHFGAQVTASQVLDGIERGDIGKRGTASVAGDANDLRFQRLQEDDEPVARRIGGFVNRTLGEGVDAVGEKLKGAAARWLPDPVASVLDEVKAGVSPMGSGSERAQAEAKDFANALRTSAYQWDKLDKWLAKTFTPEQQRKMWEAADEDGVLRRKGVIPSPDHGMNRLQPDERAAVLALQSRADAAYKQAQALGMVTGEGLESYVPRMVVQMTLGGPKVLETASARQAGKGGNLSTTTGQLRQRKYETTQETEAAAKKAFGEGAEVVRNIRTLALGTQRLERAIAGRTLVDKIKEMSGDAQAALVAEGANPDPAAFFTLNHPALTTWKPKFTTDAESGKMIPVVDQNGETVFEAHPVWVAKEFQGPLNAVLTSPSSGAVRALLDLKGKMMGVIMYSPLMHNAVIWGKAIPADPKGVMTFEAYRRGNRAKNDEATMHEALQAGLVPVSQHFDKVDTASIAAGPDLVPGRSWTAQLLAAIPNLFDKDAGESVKRAVDKAGDVWHNKFLWDRVADLQMGLYTHIRDNLISHANEIGINPQDAQRVAAHYANRYAGALPIEGMSKLARQTANIVLFSRSFTLGNLAVYKDIVAGLPSDVRAQILRDSGAEKLTRVQGVARQKAIGMLGMDVMLSYAGLFLAAGAVSWLTHQAFQSPLDNEKGKQNRVLIGYDATGTAIYARMPTGKVAEEMVDWVKDPRQLVLNKLSPYFRLLYAAAANDKGFHRQLYYPDDHNVPGWFRAVGRIVWSAAEGIAPIGQLQGMSDLLTGPADNRKSAALRALAPLAGVTISSGAPGGPAAGTYLDVKAKHDFDVQQALPDIRRQIKNGDVAGARTKMTALAIPVGLQNFYVRTTKNPATKLSGRALRDFEQMASPDEKAVFQRERDEQRQRTAALP